MSDEEIVPDFIIGGAPRSGTTFLCQALDRHPGIYVAKPFIPEPKVLINAGKPRDHYIQLYRTFFAGAGRGRILGEKTSYYLESESACALIGEVAPRARLVFIVREPVARAYSNYLWSRQNGLEELSFEDAVALEGTRASPLPPEKAYARPYDYLIRGDYATFAERYYRAFGRERVAFFLYEEITLHPEWLLRKVQEFIGAGAFRLQCEDLGLVNAARESGPPVDRSTEAALRTRVTPWVRRFAAVTGVDVEPWGYPG